MGYHNELGLALFDKSGHVVQAKFEDDWLFTFLVFLFSFSLEAVLLLLPGLWLVLGAQLHQLSKLVLIESAVELFKSWWHLQTLKKNSLLSLEANVLRPLDEAGEVLSWLDVTTDSKVAGALLEQTSLA